MNTVAVEGARTKLSIGMAGAVAYAEAAAFLVAGGWYGLNGEAALVARPRRGKVTRGS